MRLQLFHLLPLLILLMYWLVRISPATHAPVITSYQALMNVLKSFPPNTPIRLLLEGAFEATQDIETYINGQKCLYSFFKEKKVFSNLGFRRAFQLLKSASQGLLRVSDQIFFRFKDGRVPVRAMNDTLFDTAVCNSRVAITKQNITKFNWLLVLLNSLIPFRWLFKFVYRGLLQQQSYLPKNKKVMVECLGCMVKGRPHIQEITVYKSIWHYLKQLNSKLQRKTKIRLGLALLFLFSLARLAIKLKEHVMRKQDSLQNISMIDIKEKECKLCRSELRSMYVLPCKHISLCQSCFGSRDKCQECGCPINEVIQIYIS